jgi:acyl-CoA thioester hydrolase
MKTEVPKAMTIATHTITIVPRYCETDKAGVIHHSVYPVWLEMGRTELLRINGLTYKDLEKEGTFFVVAELSLKYRRPAFYDQPVVLETTRGTVTASRAEHTYRIMDQATGVLLTEARTILACVDEKGKIRRMPPFMYSPPKK